MTAKAVAEWMVQEMGASNNLYQSTIAWRMKQHWGDDYVYRNKNGNWGIEKSVLKEFEKLTKNDLVWVRGPRYWRRRTERDGPGRLAKY
jgi:uncharacterized protein DUF6953